MYSDEISTCIRLCVQVCLTVESESLALADIYESIKSASNAVAYGCFFETVEYFLQNNDSSSSPIVLPPAHVQDFIDYYTSRGDLVARLNRCLLRFDISVLDLHNVIRLCRAHLLLDALIYIFNTAFDDFVTPFEDILRLMMQPSAADQAQTVLCGNRLIVYLHECLCGQVVQHKPTQKVTSTNFSTISKYLMLCKKCCLKIYRMHR